MTRRNARFAGLIAAAAVVLLWSAWRIVDARLNTGTAIAAWGLWLVLAAALASAVAYLRELAQHRGSSRRVGWRPVPGVSLLWVAGVATVAVFAFLMPDAGAAATGRQAPVADGSTPAPGSPTPVATPTTATPTTTSPTSPTTSARPTPSSSASRSQSGVVPAAVETAAVTPRPVSTTSAPSAPATSPAPTSSTTSAPLVTLPPLPNGKPRPTK